MSLRWRLLGAATTMTGTQARIDTGRMAASGTHQVSANITGVQRGATETGSGSSLVLSAAQAPSGDSSRLKLEVRTASAANELHWAGLRERSRLAHTPCSTKRRSSFCTGRAFIGYSLANFATSASATETGSLSSSHSTTSEQGGVVSEPA